MRRGKPGQAYATSMTTFVYEAVLQCGDLGKDYHRPVTALVLLIVAVSIKNEFVLSSNQTALVQGIPPREPSARQEARCLHVCDDAAFCSCITISCWYQDEFWQQQLSHLGPEIETQVGIPK